MTFKCRIFPDIQIVYFLIGLFFIGRVWRGDTEDARFRNVFICSPLLGSNRCGATCAIILLLLFWQLHQLMLLVIFRFYTKQSWFLHGRAENGPTEPPVIGQEVWSFHILQNVQYRSEISGLRTRKTHAQFLRKRVWKNAWLNTRLRAFARIWCACFLLLFTLIYGIVLLLSTKDSSNKHHWKYLRRQTNSRYVCLLGHAHGVGVQSLVIDKRPTVTQIFSYGLNVNENNPSHRFSVILACVVAVWVSSLLPG